MVECSPATRAARVRFPADASFTLVRADFDTAKASSAFLVSLLPVGGIQSLLALLYISVFVGHVQMAGHF